MEAKVEESAVPRSFVNIKHVVGTPRGSTSTESQSLGFHPSSTSPHLNSPHPCIHLYWLRLKGVVVVQVATHGVDKDRDIGTGVRASALQPARSHASITRTLGQRVVLGRCINRQALSIFFFFSFNPPIR